MIGEKDMEIQYYKKKSEAGRNDIDEIYNKVKSTIEGELAKMNNKFEELSDIVSEKE